MKQIEIQNKEILKILKRKEEYNKKAAAKITAIQALCSHEFVLIDTSNDHDGWSWCDINWSMLYKCEICGFKKIKKTIEKYHG